MKKLTTLLAVMILLGGALSVEAADFYVNKKVGKNSFEGSKEKPFKNLQKAIDIAADGDVIHVAEGNYCGIMDKGIIKLTKQLSILGGYSADFSERDFLRYRTTVIPPKKQDTHRDDAVFFIEQGNKEGKTLIDGLIFDQGETNDYHMTAGKPEGLETGMLLIPPTKSSATAIPSANIAIMKGNASGDFTVSNCVFNNACLYGIWVAQGKGTFTVKNNIFTANRMAAVEIRGRMADQHAAKANIIDNTVLFTWARTKSMEDMGYGVRGMTACDYVIQGNILALSTFAGYDNTRINTDLKVRKTVALDRNLFFLNKEADMTAPGGGMFMRLWVEENFEDLPDLDVPGTTFTSVDGNLGLTTAEPLKNVINKAYLEGFLNASYKEVTSYDANSPANEFRRAMGMNQTGTIKSSVTMWANRYPLEDAIKLFGAVKGFGAQLP
ncbi:DUF1565 domain-containing protein [Desulfococcaceae bacterium OttesenSCG-928-F15]|nr:DUF1565 domain-containing protein [Desulfococcaceae bacterium OttesenSCG-928-F15]